MTGYLCRDCLATPAADADGRCPECGSPRLVGHAELHELAIGHVDCDAFYAAVEKRDNPALADRPVIVGGGRRGVVAACCYIARTHGVHSAMPMYRALKACPDAVVISPDIRKYAAVGRQIRAMMRALTPLVEPLSIDEAFLDLTGTERLHGGSPARTLAGLARRVERECGVSVSVGLAANKFLAKIASDLDKPRGFAAIGRAEAEDFLRDRPVGLIYGVGPALGKRLERDGIRRIGQLREVDEAWLARRYGSIGQRLARLARGEDNRQVVPDRPTKSISAETTFEEDIAERARLEVILWRLCEKVSNRLKKADLAGATMVLKLRRADFRILTRRRKLPVPTRLAEDIREAAFALLADEADGRQAFRLIGIGATGLVPGEEADRPDLLDPDRAHRAEVERAIDQVRENFGDGAIFRGRSLRGRTPEAGRDRRGAQQSGSGTSSTDSSTPRTTKSP